jgi:hypothetical protein
VIFVSYSLRYEVGTERKGAAAAAQRGDANASPGVCYAAAALLPLLLFSQPAAAPAAPVRRYTFTSWLYILCLMPLLLLRLPMLLAGSPPVASAFYTL